MKGETFTVKGMFTYTLYYDDSKRPPAVKIADALREYATKHGRPRTVYVHESEVCEVPGVAVTAVGCIRRNNYGVSQEGGTA